MGAWAYVWPRLRALTGERLPIHYIGRAASSSPAEGSFSWHAINQEALVRQALNRQPEAPETSAILFKE